jgi:virulence-associated protein VagC
VLHLFLKKNKKKHKDEVNLIKQSGKKLIFKPVEHHSTNEQMANEPMANEPMANEPISDQSKLFIMFTLTFINNDN